jgi:hypothetical protein
MGGCGREIVVSATCSLQLVNAGSAATLSQQEKNNPADVQREKVLTVLSVQCKVNHRGDIPSTSFCRWP